MAVSVSDAAQLLVFVHERLVRVLRDIVTRCEREEREHKTLMLESSSPAEEHLKNMEQQQQAEPMMNFIHRFLDDEDNKFCMDQYQKWKNSVSPLPSATMFSSTALNSRTATVLRL